MGVVEVNRAEPGPSGNYGADGIPRDGMEERYATALWRDGPSAFWLHPEGPLADTTPDEYFVKVTPNASGALNSGAMLANQFAQYPNQSALQMAYYAQQMAHAQQSAYLNGAYQNSFYSGLLGGLFRF